MRYIIAFWFSFLLKFSYGQDFLQAYKVFREKQISSNKILDSLRRTNKTRGEGLRITKKQIKASKAAAVDELNREITALDSMFAVHNANKKFDFKTADSLLLICQTSLETNLSDYMIISATDTLSFAEKWTQVGLHQWKKSIINRSFLSLNEYPGLIRVDARDTLLLLAAKRDMVGLKKLASDNPVLDGDNTTIFWGVKQPKTGVYQFETLRLPPFGIFFLLRVYFIKRKLVTEYI